MESVAGAPSCLCGLRPPLAANLKVRLLVHAHVCDNQLRLPFVARGLPYGIPVHSHCLESGVSCRPKPSHLLCCRVPCACSSPPHAVRQCYHLRVMPDYFPLHSLSPQACAFNPSAPRSAYSPPAAPAPRAMATPAAACAPGVRQPTRLPRCRQPAHPPAPAQPALGYARRAAPAQSRGMLGAVRGRAVGSLGQGAAPCDVMAASCGPSAAACMAKQAPGCPPHLHALRRQLLQQTHAGSMPDLQGGALADGQCLKGQVQVRSTGQVRLTRWARLTPLHAPRRPSRTQFVYRCVPRPHLAGPLCRRKQSAPLLPPASLDPSGIRHLDCFVPVGMHRQQ